MFQSSKLFYIEIVVSGHGFLIKTLSTKSPLEPLEVCNTYSETSFIIKEGLALIIFENLERSFNNNYLKDKGNIW